MSQLIVSMVQDATGVLAGDDISLPNPSICRGGVYAMQDISLPNPSPSYDDLPSSHALSFSNDLS